MHRIINTHTMNIKAELLERINKGSIFTATFIKKDGSTRVMNCRTNVKKYTNGVGMSYNPFEKGLLPVFDVQLAKTLSEADRKKAYRMINTKTLISIRIDNQTIKFN